MAPLHPIIDTARATGTFERRFHHVVRTPLLIIDDFGLKPMAPPHDEDFHDLISERYERAATIVTSILDFSEWGDFFPDPVLATALLNRLLHHATTISIRGDSYRLRHRRNAGLSTHTTRHT